MLKPRVYDRSIMYVPCTCNLADDVCEFPDIAGHKIGHHSDCKVYKRANYCWRQYNLWMVVANYRQQNRKCTCCKNCVTTGGIDGHCVHCKDNKRVFKAWQMALAWKNLLVRVSMITCINKELSNRIANQLH